MAVTILLEKKGPGIFERTNIKTGDIAAGNKRRRYINILRKDNQGKLYKLYFQHYPVGTGSSLGENYYVDFFNEMDMVALIGLITLGCEDLFFNRIVLNDYDYSYVFSVT